MDNLLKESMKHIVLCLFLSAVWSRIGFEFVL